MDDIINAGKTWLNHGKDPNVSGFTENYFVSQFIEIGRILVYIGIVTLLIVTAVMAIKWITATPDKQAKLKQQLIGLVVSMVVIFGAVGIWNVVKGIMQQVETELNASTNSQTLIVTAKLDECNK